MNKISAFLLLFLMGSSVRAKLVFESSLSCLKCRFETLNGLKGISNEVEQYHPEEESEPEIPVGYEHFPGVGYYKFNHHGAVSHSKAIQACKDEGAHLAIINSPAEEAVLKKMYARYPNAKNAAYLGFNDIEEEGKYVTIFGQPLKDTGFMQWMRSQPDNLEGNEDCGSMYRHGGLNDLWCNKHGPWPFFCEYEQ